MLGTGLWLYNDELVLPLFGLAEGPTAYPLKVHFHTRMAHLTYGVVAAVVTQMLGKAVE